MASRNIASMHLFLEMKKKFPDLPEDTLRSYACLYAQDQQKCIDLLQRENKNHFHSRPQFSDARLLDNKPKQEYSSSIPIGLPDPANSYSDLVLDTKNKSFIENSSIEQITTHTRSTSHAGILHLPKAKSSNLSVALQPEPKSAPVISTSARPFADMYVNKNLPSSHTQLCQIPDQNHNRMMFSTTQEHRILPVEHSESSDVEHSQRHAVKLSITPSFPFSQQTMSVQGGAVSTSTSQPSKPGRHTTSVNFQLQSPHSGADAYPIEISTIPTNIGSPCDYRDFGSHLQISVGAQGATFTALRLQRPSNYPPCLLSISEQPSSQYPNSSARSIPAHTRQVSRECAWNADSEENSSRRDVSESAGENINPQTSFMHGFQASPDYIKAVKKHQLARLDLVVEELNKEKSVCSELRSEVDKLENQLSRRREGENCLSYAEMLQRLKEENRKLQIECNCLLMEYDLNSKGLIDIGVTDEDFYSNIFTGPNDGLSLSSSDGQVSDKANIPSTNPKARTSSEEYEEDERNRWKCKNCTFANHPALEKCEMCEIPRNSGFFFIDNSA